MGMQTKIAQKIIDKKADYVLALKGNHGQLHTDLSASGLLGRLSDSFRICPTALPKPSTKIMVALNFGSVGRYLTRVPLKSFAIMTVGSASVDYHGQTRTMGAG